MPRAAPLSELEKGKILSLEAEGFSKAEIAEKINRSRKVVYNFFGNKDGYGKNRTGGPKKKLTDRQVKKITQKASNSTLSCNQLGEMVGSNVFKTTIWRVLRDAPNIVRRKMKKAPHLLPQHKEARLKFCKENVRTNWKQVIFSDEKKWNLDGPDGFNDYWRDLNKEPLIFSKRNFGGGSLMVWGAFHFNGVLELQVVNGRMKSSDYINLLECSLLRFLEQNSHTSFTFQQDNAPIHVSKQTLEWLGRKNVQLMKWPACSPDMNPIENIWGILARRVYANNKRYNNVQELKTKIFMEWEALEPTLLHNLIFSMDDRIFKCTQNKGSLFK